MRKTDTMDDDVELIVPDNLEDDIGGIFPDFSQVQIQVHASDVAEKIIEGIAGDSNNHEIYGTEEYLHSDIDNSIQEISDDYPDQIQAESDTITEDFKENIVIDKQDIKSNITHKYSNIQIEIDEIKSDNYQEDNLDDVDRIPDSDISKYEAVIEEYPDYANVPIKEEIEPLSEPDYNDPSLIEEHNDDTLPLEDVYHYNVMVLGSKPCQSYSNGILRRLLNERDSIEEKIEVKKEYLNAVVMLEDWGVNLENSESFCNSCGTLFATQNDLDAHNMSIHSFLVPVNKNVAVKSTTKPAFARKSTGTMFVKGNKNIARKSTGSKAMGSTFCNHCNKVFPDNTTLIKHLYELLPLKQFSCSTCNIVFQTQKDLTEHNVVHVEPENIRVKKEKSDKKSAVVRKKILYEEDVKKTHPASLKGELEAIPKSVLFQCPKCGLHFVTASYGFRHYLNCDPSGSKKLLACDICKRKIHTKDREIHKKQHKICSKFRVFKVNKDLCERVLCKCPDCELYFGECGMTMHLKDCGRIKSMRCQICNVLMPKTRIYSHMRVHKRQNLKLKDFLIVHFDFQRPAVKRKMEPPRTPTKRIKLENSKIQTNLKLQIKREPTMYMSIEEKPLQIMKKTVFETKGSKFRLLICTACKGCSYMNNDRGIHLKKQCVSRAYSDTKVICPDCGLQFTRTTIKHHRYRQHKEQLTIHNIFFFDIRTLKKTVPCIPDYPQCSDCKIKFFEARVLAEHICGEDYDTCHVCGDNYHSTVYNKHIEFHKLITAGKPFKKVTKPIPDLMKKYQSLNKMWNIVYGCKMCDIITDQYDKAVEHSQGHYNQEPSATNIKCYICNLKFDETCWSKHSELHSQMKINSTDFKILMYDPQKLLTEEWFELFQSLPKEQIRQVTDKSVYGYERRFQMKLLKQGRSEFTVYCCKDCNVACRNNEIEKHINSICKDSTNICQVCSIPFCDISTLKTHQILHMNGIKKEEFRVVSFSKQQAINKTKQQTRTKVNPEIKHKKQKPSYKTKQRATYKTKHPKLPTKNAVGISINKFGNMSYRGIRMDSNGKYILYKCRNCQSCIHITQNMRKHQCHTQILTKKCKHCGMFIYAKNIRLHEKRHMDRPDFNSENFVITLFDPPNNTGSDNEFEPAKKKRKTSRYLSKKVKKKVSKAVSPDEEINDSVADKASPTKSKADTSNVSSSAKVPVIYKCACGLHYTSLQSIEKHVQTCDTDTDISKEHCSKCGLLFPTDVLVSHLCKHHSKTSKFNVELYHKDTEINNVESTSESPVPLKKTQLNCKVKLYKCNECNVYFVNQNTCYKHTYYNHQAINQRVCIECKLCGLQFTLKTLTLHVNRHHSAELRLEDILVEEYWPNVGKGPVKRELYIAGDKVQSFQVTSSVDEQ